jgi:hypothetical protein
VGKRQEFGRLDFDKINAIASLEASDFGSIVVGC